jgi:hypothetical protein
MSPYTRFRDASDDNQSRGCSADSSTSRAKESYDRRADDADATLRDKQASDRASYQNS